MSRIKPAKPHGSPLTPHRNGQWVKKIRGRLFYFGVWGDHDGAVLEYLRIADDLHAGRAPRVRSVDGATVEYIANAFLQARRERVDRGELSLRTWTDYRDMAKRLFEHFGIGRAADSLGPLDFRELLGAVGKDWGAVRRGKFVGFVRMVFRWAVESDLMDRAPKYGPDFAPPSKLVARQAKHRAGGAILKPATIRKAISCASPPMKAIILLGINGAFGNIDCAMLPEARIDRFRKLIDWPRPKTGLPRVCKLWPETVKAIDEWLAVRRREHEGLLFTTKYGKPWSRFEGATRDDAIAKAFRKLLRQAGESRAGVGFYALRRTFRTVAGETLDRDAVRLIMGHAFEGMDEHYLQRIGLARLSKVSEHVRRWLFRD